MVETVIIAGARHEPASEAGQEALVRAQAARTPVYCACSPLEPAMYIARLKDRLIVKRMPGTGLSTHLSVAPLRPQSIFRVCLNFRAVRFRKTLSRI